MSSQQPSYQELLETCEELRKTAARAIGIKQELIETKEALDSELGRYRQLQRYVCLLYTSPSPRDRTRSRMPSSA